MNRLKQFIATNRKSLIVPAMVVLVIIGLVNFYFIFEVTAQSNDECLWKWKRVSPDSVAVVFDYVKFEGVTWEAGIRDGDQLLEINNKKIDNINTASLVLDRVAEGDSAAYVVKKPSGEVITTNVYVKKLISMPGLAGTLFAFIWLVVGFVVIMAKPNGYTQLLFFRIGALSTLAAMFSLFWRGNATDNPVFEYSGLLLTVDTLWTFGASFLPFVYVNFFWHFPNRLPKLDKKWVRNIIYIGPFVVFTASILLRVIVVWGMDYHFLYGVIASLHFILIFVALIVGFTSLFRSYLKLKSPNQRNAIFIILVGYGFGLASLVYFFTLAEAIADTIFNSPEYFMPILLIVVVPISFAYSIFRYSLMDISDFVKNAILYSAATLTLAGAYFLVIYLIGQGVSHAIGTQYEGIIAGAIFIVFAVIFQSTKDKFQDILTQRFYPEQFAYQKVLLKFGSDVATIVGLDNILKSTEETLVTSLKLDTFAIFIRNYKEDKFEISNSEGVKEKELFLDNTDHRLKKLINNKQLLKQLPVLERNEFEEAFPDDYHKLIEEKIETIIPLTIKSKIIGLLAFGVKYSGSKFAGKDLELLVAAANQTAVSIENARLYELEAEKIKLESDLESARRIQQSLLPASIPEVKGLDIAGYMEAAMHVGGDYYDVIRVSDSKVFVVIGDVSGKGLSASFYMTKMQTITRLYCTEGRSPKEILTKVNKRLYNEIDRHSFITATVALFDLEEKTVTYCRAGHTPLVYINNSTLEMKQPQGMGIGLEPGDKFASSLVQEVYNISDNDLYFFFSDGVNEAMNKSNDQFGMERLNDLLKKHKESSSNELIKTIASSLDYYRKGAARNDDVTMVIVKVTS